MQLTLCETNFTLLSEKALWRHDTEQLIIADIHLGKASHFRKAGISLPADSVLEDILRLEALMQKLNPKEVIFLGDLFHSNYNREWQVFENFLQAYPDISFVLVKGNHDILKKQHYRFPNFSVMDVWQDDLFIYTHEPMQHASRFVLSGHIHPGITLTGKGKQRLSLGCFHVSQNQMVLPAFGKLTGLFLLEKNKSDSYYIIYNDLITKV